MATATTATEAAARSRLITVDSYAIFLDLTAPGDTARSRTEVTFSCHEPGAATFADLDPVALHEATLNGKPLDPSALSHGRLLLTGLAARNSLTVDVTVPVATDGRGLTRYTDPADGQRYVLAHCYPTAAPRVFCCFDQPDLRAKLSLIVTLPAGWACVATGETLHHPDGAAAGAWYFSAVPAFRPYDFALVAGPYVTAGQVSAPRPGSKTSGDAAETVLAMRCRPILARSTGLTRIAGIVAATLRYYEQLLAVPCPYRKLDIVFVPELATPAMQLPAVMCVSETLLQRAADQQDDFVAVVLAHEAAHLWFGCLVESRWWDDLWLAEAMASYLSYTAATAVLDQPDAWAEFGMTGQASAYQADGLPSTQPVSSPVATAADALTRPTAITYSKGTSVIRQLGALIGADSVHTGLHDYLTRHAWTATSLADLTDCWSAASERDLTAWAAQWLEQSGVNVLRPEIIVDPDGTITSLAIVQDPPATDGAGPLRAHRLTIGSYDAAGSRLSCRRRISVTVRGAWTHVPELTGSPRPAAIILNDTDLAYATTRFDPVSWRALVTVAMDVSDPLAESVCWSMAAEMVEHAELAAAQYTALVSRRITSGEPVAGLDQLLDRAVAAADRYAGPDQRTGARRQLAAAALASGERARPGSRRQRVLARGYAAAADSPAQLVLLRLWLEDRSLPAGLVLDLELRARILTTLAAKDLAADSDLAGYAAADPVGGDTVVAGCTARRPTRAAKEAAWAAALDVSQPPRLARATAEGFWVPGQETLTCPFRSRYFAEALPMIRAHDARTAQRLARALYPATLADEATLAATSDAIAGTPPADAIRPVLVEQREILRRTMIARLMDGSSV
ncbi:MAG: aminopeptidase N [Streptosporangiaceae bacterium]